MSHDGQDRAPLCPDVCWGMGLFALDIVVEGETEGPFPVSAGGSCCNTLAILSWFDWSCYPITQVGGDEVSELLWKDLNRFNVKADHLAVDPRYRSPVIVEYLRRRRSPGHRFDFVCPRCRAWFPRYRGVGVKQAEAVVNTLAEPTVFFFDRVSPAAIKVAEQARNLGALVVLDLSANCSDSMVVQGLRVSHVIKYAHRPGSSARLIGFDVDHPTLFVETAGAEGLRYCVRGGAVTEGWISLPAYSLGSVVDAAGAGDWCTAGFIHKIRDVWVLGRKWPAAGDQLATALNFGQALAAINCQFVGARGAMYHLRRDELVTRAQLLAESVEVSPITRGPWTGSVAAVQAACPKCRGIAG